MENDITVQEQKKVEVQAITVDDATKAKKRGSLFGDPVFIVE